MLEDADANALLIVVADGMGGHEGGALAAQTIIDQTNELWNSRDKSLASEDFLLQLIKHCHHAVIEAGNSEKIKPRSTIAALYINPTENDKEAVSVHAGDSRILQFSDSALELQTFDHSIAQLKVLQGKISQEEVATDPDQNKVITSIGGDEEPESEITRWDLNKGKRFVVCSDGFWELFTPEDMQYLFDSNKNQSDEDETLAELIEQIYLSKLEKQEKHDNTTVVMLANEPQSSETISTVSEAGAPVKSQPQAKYSSGVFLAIAAITIIIASFIYFLNSNPDSNNDTGMNTPQQSPSSSVGSGSDGNAPGENTESAPQDDQSEASSPPVSEGEAGASAAVDGDSLSSVDQELEFEVASNEELIDLLTGLLRQNGSLGADDELTISQESSIDDSVTIRLSQLYNGIPVFGAEVITIQTDGERLRITGELAADLELDTSPQLSYEEAQAVAAQSLGVELTAEGEGQLIIYNSNEDFLLAWIGLLTLDQAAQEQFVLHAEDGSVLARFPTLIDESQ